MAPVQRQGYEHDYPLAPLIASAIKRLAVERTGGDLF
jgi:hypothetical protein